MRRAIATAAVALLVAGSAPATDELEVGFVTDLEYDDNVFNTPSDEEQDVAFRVGPRLRLRRPDGDFTYDLRWTTRWESYIDLSGLDAFDHAFAGRASYRLGPRTTLTASDRWGLTRSRSRAADLVGADEAVEFGGPIEPGVELFRQRLKQNNATVSLSHNFTERVTGTASVTHAWFEREVSTSTAISGQASGTYALSPRNTVGGGVGFSRQEFEPEESSFGDSTSDFYRAFLIWNHVFDPTLNFQAQVGPTWVEREANLQDSALTTEAPIVSTADLQFLFDPFGNPLFDPTGTFRLATVVPAIQLFDLSSCPRLDNGTPFFSAECELAPDGVIAAGEPGFDALTDDQFILIRQMGDDRGSSSSLTFFASVVVNKSWGENLRTQLRYTRSDNGTAGTGSSTIVDSVVGQAVWSPSVHWTLTLAGAWTQRTSATDGETNVIALKDARDLLGATEDTGLAAFDSLQVLELDTSDFAVTSFQGRFQVDRDLTRRSTAFLELTYLIQETDRGDLGSTDFDNFRILLGFRWNFDPIRL